MIHVYNAGDDLEKDGKKYTIKCINENDIGKYISDGWVRSLDLVGKKKKAIKKESNEAEKKLMKEVDELKKQLEAIESENIEKVVHPESLETVKNTETKVEKDDNKK